MFIPGTRRKGITSMTNKRIPTPPVVSVGTSHCVGHSAPAPWGALLRGRKMRSQLTPVAAHLVSVLNAENKEMCATPALFTMRALMQEQSAQGTPTSPESP